MKWATIRSLPIPKEISSLYPHTTTPKTREQPEVVLQQLKNYVEELKISTPGNLYAEGFAEWLIVPKDQMPLGLTESDKVNYNLFIGGFLYYFENHISNIKGDDRTLFIDWGKINTKAALTIYLKPLYRPYYTRDGVLIELLDRDGRLQDSRGNIQINISRSPLAPPPAPDVDPPQPPTPPPPPRHLSGAL